VKNEASEVFSRGHFGSALRPELYGFALKALEMSKWTRPTSRAITVSADIGE
jgi:hypothetical protein